MNFKKTLNDISNAVEGSLGVVLIGTDGLPVDEYYVSEVENDAHLKEISVESGNLFKQGVDFFQRMNLGSGRQIVLKSSKYTTVFHVLNADYYLLMILGKDSFSGKASYLLNRYSEQFSAEL